MLSVTAASNFVNDLSLTYQWYIGLSGDTKKPAPAVSPSTSTGSRYAAKNLTANTYYWVRVFDAEHRFTDSATALVRVYDHEQPNIAPMPVSARWSDALVVSANPHGTADDAAIVSTRPLFVGLAYKNIGIATANPFKGTITLQPGQ